MKYHNKKVIIDGHKFDSRKEGEHYLELKRRQNLGEISNLELQPSFLLQEGFKRDGKKYQPITYIADFRYIENGKVIVEDVKGFKTLVYMIKKKLLLYKYDDFEFREVKPTKKNTTRRKKRS